MVRDVRLLEISLGKMEIFMEPAVAGGKIKLERSIAVRKDLKAGEFITENDLHLLSPGDGFKWTERDKIVALLHLKLI